MNKLDYEEVKKHINILNVAYHLNLEIIEEKGNDCKAICPFCGYNKLTKIPTLNLNIQNNKYCCSRCGAGGYSVGLYAKLRKMDNKKAFKELLDRECFSLDRVPVEISPINLISDIEIRDKVYREFLGMLKLELQHKKMLKNMGFLESSLEYGLYKTVPQNYIKRRLICYNLAKKYKLAGIPGFFQEEDFKWNFSGGKGFFVPVFNKDGLIQGLSIHLDKTFNNTSDIWFSSSSKINGTGAKNWVMRNNINQKTNSILLTDNFLLGNLIKETINYPTIAFQNISNSYQILKEIEDTNVTNITFVLRINHTDNLDYIIRRIFRDLIPLGYNLDVKTISNYKDFFDDNSNNFSLLKEIA